MNKQTVRIVGANKNVRKSFDNINEAEAHIVKNGLFPVSKKYPLQIEVTNIEYHKVNVEFPELSKSIKETLIQVLRDNIKEIDFSNLRIAGNIHDIYIYGDKSKYKKFLRDFIQDEYNLSDEEMKKYYAQYSWDDGGVEAPFDNDFYDDKFLETKGPVIIEELLNSTKLEDIEFKYIQTNYKPCHNINVVVQDQSFQIRMDDIRFAEGEVTGRNVSVSKVSDLTDGRFNKFFKKTKFHK